MIVCKEKRSRKTRGKTKRKEEEKMKRKMKKTAALALTLGMTAVSAMASYGADAALPSATVEDVAISTSNASGTVGGSQASTLTGTIKVTSISVKVPTAAAFLINPNAKTTGDDVNRITDQSDAYTITNTSTVPIDVRITNVTTALGSGTTGTPTTLVNKADALSGARTVMFAIRKDGDSIPTNASGDSAKWFDPAANYTTAPYNVCDTPTDGTLAAGGTLKMKLYGATTTGWANNETFTVIPTFTISVH